MKRTELADYYLPQYSDTNVTLTDVTHFGDCVAFDLSDGTHWLSDNSGTYKVGSSLTGVEIGWSDTYGWIIVNEDGSESQVEWCD